MSIETDDQVAMIVFAEPMAMEQFCEAYSYRMTVELDQPMRIERAFESGFLESLD